MECAGWRRVERVGVLHGSILRAGGTRGDEQDEREKAGGRRKHQHLFFSKVSKEATRSHSTPAVEISGT
jgi:hypothetical protein